MTVSFRYRHRKNSKTAYTNTITVNRVPIVLNNGKFPTKRTEEVFLKRVFKKFGRGKFDQSNIKIVRIDNIKHSSKLAYKFDHNKH